VSVVDPSALRESTLLGADAVPSKSRVKSLSPRS
jgi:hypothetical protein